MYLEKLKALHSLLGERNGIKIIYFYVAPPLPEAKLNQFGALQHLPTDLLQFYNETNGLQLVYTRTSNQDFDEKEFRHYSSQQPYLWPNEKYWQLDGCINILPLDVMLAHNWKDYLWFDLPSLSDRKLTYKGHQTDAQAFEKALLPFDVFSKESIAVLHTEPAETAILLSTDHNASYTDYPPIKFNAYVEGIIATEGLIEKRAELFQK